MCGEVFKWIFRYLCRIHIVFYYWRHYEFDTSVRYSISTAAWVLVFDRKLFQLFIFPYYLPYLSVYYECLRVRVRSIRGVISNRLWQKITGTSKCRIHNLPSSICNLRRKVSIGEYSHWQTLCGFQNKYAVIVNEPKKIHFTGSIHKIAFITSPITLCPGKPYYIQFMCMQTCCRKRSRITWHDFRRLLLLLLMLTPCYIHVGGSINSCASPCHHARKRAFAGSLQLCRQSKYFPVVSALCARQYRIASARSTHARLHDTLGWIVCVCVYVWTYMYDVHMCVCSLAHAYTNETMTNLLCCLLQIWCRCTRMHIETLVLLFARPTNQQGSLQNTITTSGHTARDVCDCTLRAVTWKSA